jgi:hypothetical protein
MELEYKLELELQQQMTRVYISDAVLQSTPKKKTYCCFEVFTKGGLVATMGSIGTMSKILF